MPVIPSRLLNIALFITELAGVCINNNTGVSSIDAVLYQMGQLCGQSGIVPTSHPFLKSSVEGAKRMLAGPVQSKEPLSIDLVQPIADAMLEVVLFPISAFYLFCWLVLMVLFVLTKLRILARMQWSFSGNF